MKIQWWPSFIRTGRHNEANSCFRNFANAPRNCTIIFHMPATYNFEHVVLLLSKPNSSDIKKNYALSRNLLLLTKTATFAVYQISLAYFSAS